MANQILTASEWNQILERLLSLFTTHDIPYKEHKIQQIIICYAVIGEKYEDSSLLANFKSIIESLDQPTKLSVYRTIAERLYKTSDKKEESLQYYRKYLDLLNDKQILASKYGSSEIGRDIYLLKPVLSVTDESIFSYALSICKNIISLLSTEQKINSYFSIANILLENDKYEEAINLVANANKLEASTSGNKEKVESLATNQIELHFAIQEENKEQLLHLFNFFFEEPSFLTSYFHAPRCFEIIDYFYSIDDIEHFTMLIEKIFDLFRYRVALNYWDSNTAEKELIHTYLPLLIEYCIKWNYLDKFQPFKNLLTISYTEENLFRWDSRIQLAKQKLGIISIQEIEQEIKTLLSNLSQAFENLYKQISNERQDTNLKSIYNRYAKQISNILQHSYGLIPQKLYDESLETLLSQIKLLSNQFFEAKQGPVLQKSTSLYGFYYTFDIVNLFIKIQKQLDRATFNQLLVMCLDYLQTSFSQQILHTQVVNIPHDIALLEVTDHDSKRNFTVILRKINTLFLQFSSNDTSTVEQLIIELDEYFSTYTLDFSNELFKNALFTGFQRNVASKKKLDYANEEEKHTLYDFITTKLFEAYISVIIQGKYLEKSSQYDTFLAQRESLTHQKLLEFSLALAKSNYRKESKLFLDHYVSKPTAIVWEAEDQRLYPPKRGHILIHSNMRLVKSYDTPSIDKVRVYQKLKDKSKAKEQLKHSIEQIDTHKSLLNQFLLEALKLQEKEQVKTIIKMIIKELNKEIQRDLPFHQFSLKPFQEERKQTYLPEKDWQEIKDYTIKLCKEIFGPNLENMAVINGAGHLSYLIQLFLSLGEEDLSDKGIKKVETYYSILRERLPEEKRAELPVINSESLLTEQEVANLDQVLGQRRVLLPKAMSPVEHFEKREKNPDEYKENMQIVLSILLNYYEKRKDSTKLELINSYKTTISEIVPEFFRKKTTLFVTEQGSRKEETDLVKDKEKFYQLFEMKLAKPSKYDEYYNEIFYYLRRIEDLS